MKVDQFTREHKPLESTADLEKLSAHESLENFLFEQYMRSQLVNDFFEQMEEYGISEKTVKDMQDAVSPLGNDEVLAALSLPFEIREKWYSDIERSVESGKETPEDFVQRLVGLGKKYQFTIGYHTSPNDILPDENGQWQIHGTENDHRDNDLSMAYYSNKYRHLFKKKGPKFIYVVRAEKGHRSDGNWNRAPSLSVVMRLPFEQVVQYVDATVKEIEQNIANKSVNEKSPSA